MEDVMTRRRELVQAVHAGITKRSARDEQRSIGPSEIGNPCDYCVGRALCRRYPHLWNGSEELGEDHFSLKAWLGTAVHEKLERDVFLEHARKEQTLTIAELDGYGQISGHADLAWNGIICDYKTIDKRRLDLVRVQGPPEAYLTQISLYAYGASLHHGMDIDQTCLFFIPRDSNKAQDMLPLFSGYAPARAERALKRLEELWGLVQQGHARHLSRDEECYRCTVMTWG